MEKTVDVMASQQDAFQGLLDRHAGILYRVVNTYARHADDQSDLIQEIKVNLWQAFPKYDPARSFSTWMYRIALNTAISSIRKSEVRQRHEPVVSPSQPPDENVKALYELIDSLDPMSRALLMLYLDDLSHAEIGEVLGITPGNVATRISRLKQQLRQQTQEEEKQWNLTI